ncbi:MAG: hypothetical protein A3A80_03275 [Candidatus Terrybacteria bacterium RIFCSPLOWO2_01_FULL_44_24]|uniref:Uncharacterized protein n=1 Tax=Candidatus Terrybacteria bacterium RIFCSPHIGHO2_01_FULL_43_35 TaxID=1802361 RepID=A0A1G2PEB9_9BACT|nr:MAG: hypothetical protein A2828_00825 [Candidatus Terrybacteria bacterium RIFCSPHIGHO2_01_FULL_43_35]OHA51151.1 MAG: hypothetical protein A3A80_03275 [Candidatus Terrybacteria bacterium RIFCSPLOWO2_01_FULL_44_24]
MKKLYRLAALVSVLAPTSVVLAVTPVPPPTGITSIGGLLDLICQGTNLLFTVIMLLSIIILLYAAFLFLTGGGSEDKLTQARQYLTYAVVGIVVALLAKGLVLVVVTAVGTSASGIPTCP